MNLAYRDMRHNAGRLLLTCIGLSLLLGVVVTMAGIYRGQMDDALVLVRAARPDVWVVEAGTHGPFAESSRIAGDTREMIARQHGVVAAGAVTYQTVQTEVRGQPLRLYVVGYEPGRPGGPRSLVAGRRIVRSHYELIADTRTGLGLGQELRLGRHTFTVVGLTRDQVTLAGDAVVYMTLLDAQELQFDVAPPVERREAARGATRVNTDVINAVAARVAPDIPPGRVAADIRRWKHLSALTQAEQEEILTRTVIERVRRQLGLFMVLLVIVSAVIIALIIYTLTMDKLRSIATLKLIGAPDRVIIGLIVQQALVMGVAGLGIGAALVRVAKDQFPRRVVMAPEDLLVLLGVVVGVCLLASALGVRLAIRVDPAKALAG
jgi:putative ABC transport system permease protein